MIDYIPADIPKAVVKYADEHINKPENLAKRKFRYVCEWKGLELYFMYYVIKGDDSIYSSHVIPYDCHEVVKIKNKNNQYDMRLAATEHIGKYTLAEHVCHRDKRAFNRHTKPSDYDIKIRHIAPRYIPQAVIEYIDKRYPDSMYPGATRRRIKYFTTWKDYEVYIVYWYSFKPRRRSNISPFLYNGENVSMMGYDTWLKILSEYPNPHHSYGRPYLYNKD
jgi:hypothetical protein